VQLAPRRHAVEFGQEAVAPCEFFLAGTFEVGDALLYEGSRAVVVAVLSQVGPQQSTVPDE